jgi:hypothetical protein
MYKLAKCSFYLQFPVDFYVQLHLHLIGPSTSLEYRYHSLYSKVKTLNNTILVQHGYLRYLIVL